MQLPLYQVDAFATQVLRGNPAAVCPLEQWLPDALMQAVALENNLSETAFFVPADGDYDFHLRWFTPLEEVDLCGHATLATAWVIFHKLGFDKPIIRFKSLSGLLTVERKGTLLALNFPEWPLMPVARYDEIATALGVRPVAVFKSHDWVAVLESETQLKALAPDQGAMGRLDCRGVIVTAPGDAADFASRAFFPKLGVPEDPVCGSAHCALTPYWSERLGKTKLLAHQVSTRPGELHCTRLPGGRVEIAGEAQLFLEGTCYLP